MANRRQSRYGRVDANQKEVVERLRKCGFSVAILSNIGKGVPDLLVGANGINYLIELKDGSKPPSQRRLTEDEKAFAESWRGFVAVCNSADEILELIDERH